MKKGQKHSAASIAKMVAAHTGLKNPKAAEIGRASAAKISAAKVGRPSHPQTAETRAKIGTAHRGKSKPWALKTLELTRTVAARAKLAASARARNTGQIRPAAWRAAIARGLKGKPRPASVAAKIRAGLLAGTIKLSSGNRWQRLPHLDRRGRLWTFRSTWEVKFAQHLDAEGLTWDYEPHRLLLSDGRIYVPDFWVVEWASYVEVKGWRGWNADKIELARADGHRVQVVGDITKRGAGVPSATEEATR